MKNVYTKNSTGMILLTFIDAVIHKAVEMHAGFQVQDKGAAFRYFNNRTIILLRVQFFSVLSSCRWTAYFLVHVHHDLL